MLFLAAAQSVWRSIAPFKLRRAAGYLTGRVIYESTLQNLAWSKASRGRGQPALVGFFSGSSGVARSVQLASRALDQLGIEHRRIDVGDVSAPNDPGDLSASAWIFYVNPPELMQILFKWGGTRLQGPRFAHWAWELSKAPQAWKRAHAAVNGVMAQSRYTADSFSPRTVNVTPHPLFAEDFAFVPQLAQSPATTFTVVSLFDFKSSFARKNPLGAVAAFHQAFGDDPTARLILKMQNADVAPDLAAKLRSEAGPNVEIVDAIWSRTQVMNLIASADALISLHRAEGFGLILAEAMMLGTPVVATAWSGNLDFMTEDTACLAPARLVPVDDSQGIYRGQSWAEPDVQAAARYLSKLRDDPHFANAKATRAAADIGRRLAPQAWFKTLPDGLRKVLTEWISI